MFGTRRFENPFDPEDDGRDLEIAPDEEAASDDQGREEAKVLLDQMGTTERNQNDRNFRRWLLRLAKKALAEGAERRRIARKKEKARAAAEAEAERRRKENATKAEKSRRAFERYCRESDERWSRIDEETRTANSAWEAGRPAREAAERAARADALRSSTNASTGASRPTAPGEASRRAISTAATPPQPTAPTKPAAQPRASPLPGAGSTVHQQAPAARRTATVTPPTRASTVQPRRESPGSIELNPPSTLRPFTPPAVAKAARPAPPCARPIPATPTPTMRSIARPSPTSETRRSTRSRLPLPTLAASQPLPPPPPPIAPAPPEPPPFTGADLAGYRTSLGLSQGVLAARLGTTQGTVSKAEGNPTALLGPTLRSAMWDAQRSGGGLPGEP